MIGFPTNWTIKNAMAGKSNLLMHIFVNGRGTTYVWVKNVGNVPTTITAISNRNKGIENDPA